MFCIQCGAELREGASFCTKCGAHAYEEDEDQGLPAEEETAPSEEAPINNDMAAQAINALYRDDEVVSCEPTSVGFVRNESVSDLPVSGEVAPDEPAPDEPAPDEPAQKKSSKGKVIAIVAAVLVVAAVAIGVFVKINMDQKAAEEANAALHPIPVSIVAPAFDENATRIPVRIEGESVTGDIVDELVFLNPNGTGIELARGTYRARFPGGYIAGDGMVCQAPDTVVEINVTGEGAGNTEISVSEDNVQFNVVSAGMVSDELINEISENAKQDPDDNGKLEKLTQQAAEKRANAQEQQQRIADEKAAVEQALQVKRELDEAYAANPSLVYASPSKSSDPVTLTGVVDVRQGENIGTGKMEDVCLLILPSEITVSGTQYGDQSNYLLILSKDLAGYQGQTVTVETQLSVRGTSSIAEARFSPIWANSANVVRVFEIPDISGMNVTVAYMDVACEAAKALFTNAKKEDGVVSDAECTFAQYLAEGSTAAERYPNGWDPNAKSIALDAQVTGHEGNVFSLDVTFETIGGDNKPSGHVAHLTLTFDEGGHIIDLAADVV